MHKISENKVFEGMQFVYEHGCVYNHCKMRFAMFVPHYATKRKPSAGLIYLSGLTCTWENVMVKSGIQRIASECNLIIIAPDTSPRGKDIPDNEAINLGQGAGFYVDATESPWDKHYNMYSYITKELPNTAHSFEESLDLDRLGIMGHSMGGHGALTIGIKNPHIFRSLSAFSPICNPMESPWGKAALHAYLGDDKAAWEEYDTCALLQKRGYDGEILVEQGGNDEFINEELMPNKLHAVCKSADVPLQLNLRKGYDHSYYFISSFIADHVKWHAKKLES